MTAQTNGQDLESIPDFLDRTKGMTDEQIKALSAKARKNAGRPRKAALLSAPERDSGLTDVDRANIKALKKAGADKVSVVRQIGAKLKLKPMTSREARDATTRAMVAAVDGSKTATEPPPQEVNQESAMIARKTNLKTETAKTARQPGTARAGATKKPTGKKPGKVVSLKTPSPKTVKPPAGKSKAQVVQDMLTSETGATRKELSAASGWPSVNLKMAAKRAGMKLVEDEATGHCRLIAA